MSNVGKKAINFRSNVTVEVDKDNNITVLGKLGKASLRVPRQFEIVLDKEDLKLMIIPHSSDKNIKALWGLYRSLLSQMVVGVSLGYTVQLEIVGIGYRVVSLAKNELSFKIGYNREILYKVPLSVDAECIKPTLIRLKGLDKQTVYQIAADIRSLRVPDSYKGKGIRFLGEKLQLKEGKKK